LEAQISALEKEQPRIAMDLRLAAADKDFRENAPLEAAREEHEQIVTQLKNLKSMLQSAVVMDENTDALKVNLGSVVTVREVDTGEESSYIMTSPNEIDAAKGKISALSPMGKALLNHMVGDSIEVITPGGKLCCRIERIEPERREGEM
jgi:transcription elongation factor GreA